MKYGAVIIVAQPGQSYEAERLTFTVEEAQNEDHARRLFAVTADSLQRARRKREVGHKGQLVRFLFTGKVDEEKEQPSES